MLSNQEPMYNYDLPPSERSLYYKILCEEYTDIKNKCRYYWVSRSDQKYFSEDIFHDTIVNSANTCCKMTSKNEIYKYICKAYYFNMIREQQYMRNLIVLKRYNQFSSRDLITYKDDDFKSFKNEIFEFIKKNRGERVARIIFDYINGYSCDEISKKYDIKNIYKKLPALKQYMKDLIINWDKL